ncbi:hypothetical protein PoB_004674600 [Plakobranchus ocellatus]|uniref:Uncharacterized protein n=1 Tax=Plakobranchus ocellatus TaxID=259542 RepID=A0AAV4BII1_9GAST|nr:hypothetical protein PoB_004674600 [Plakobranchus ocellatus]
MPPMPIIKAKTPKSYFRVNKWVSRLAQAPGNQEQGPDCSWHTASLGSLPLLSSTTLLSPGLKRPSIHLVLGGHGGAMINGFGPDWDSNPGPLTW